MRSILSALATLCAFNAAVGFTLGLFQQFHPALDSFSHFRLHFVAVLAVSCAALVILERGKARWSAALIALVGAGWLGLQTQKGPPSEGPRGDIRLVQFNLNFRNTLMAQVGDALIGYDADVITLQEVPPAHEAVLRGLTAYPHQAHCSFRHYVGGVSILSKYPLSYMDCAEGQGLVTARLDTPGGPVTIASVHTLWPWPFNQHAQVDKWTKRLRQIWGPMIIAGDFNAAAWSHSVSKVADASRSAPVPGVRMTIGVKVFPVLPAVPIPIDHVLLSETLCATSARVLETIGSDHYPVSVEIARTGTDAAKGCTSAAPSR